MKLNFLLLVFLFVTGISSGKFDEMKWKSDSNRSKQAKYLVRDKVLLGKSYNEVIKLLGEENIRPIMVDTCRFTIEYILGTVLIDFERLQVNFESCRVVSVSKYHN